MSRIGATPGLAARALAGLEAQPRLTALMGAMAIAFSGIFYRYSDVSPSTATVFRCLYALPFLALLAWSETRSQGPRSRRSHLVAIAAGVFFASDLTLYHHGVEFVGAGLGTVIPNLQVVIVAIVGWLLHQSSVGLHLRAAGEQPASVDAAGVSVLRVRTVAELS
ncbi:MAG: EamA family transporter, partial [Chloroflexota bacterium]|nr:EamA family transporter [Chloroflexota bacterium]